MSGLSFMSYAGPHAGFIAGAPDKSLRPTPGGAFGLQRLPTDPAGSFSLAFSNAVAGSRYRIERAADGSLVTSGDVPASSFSLSLNYYQPGNPNNNLRIKLRKGTSAPFYIPWETLAVAAAGVVPVYVSQIPDE